jgi:hypothetical protein
VPVLDGKELLKRIPPAFLEISDAAPMLSFIVTTCLALSPQLAVTSRPLVARTRGGLANIRAADLAAPPAPPPLLKPPLSMYEGVVAAGAAKAAMPAGKIFVLGVIAGCHIVRVRRRAASACQ